MKKLKISCCERAPENEPAFSVGHFGILHVNLMFGKYWRGVNARMFF